MTNKQITNNKILMSAQNTTSPDIQHGEFIYINIYVIKYKKQTNLYYNLFLRTWHTNNKKKRRKITNTQSHPLNTHFWATHSLIYYTWSTGARLYEEIAYTHKYKI